MWSPFKKKKQQSNSSVQITNNAKDDDKDNSPKMNMLQRLAMKKLAKMSPQEQQKLMQEAFKPGNREKLLSAMEMMKKTGQITEEQYQMAKQKMGM